MESEEMRRILAERCMGWECCELGEDGKCELWSGIPGVGPMRVRDWQPDTDWTQCGMVIDKMARKRFLVHMSIYTREDGTQAASATCSRFTPGPPAKHIYAQGASIDSNNIPLLVCEAMSYALESEANDD